MVRLSTNASGQCYPRSLTTQNATVVLEGVPNPIVKGVGVVLDVSTAIYVAHDALANHLPDGKGTTVHSENNEAIDNSPPSGSGGVASSRSSGSATPEPEGEEPPQDEYKTSDPTKQLLDTGKLLDPSDKAGELIRAGRALQKHGGRRGSAFPAPKRNPAAINAAGQAELDAILNDTHKTINNGNRFGGKDVTQVTAEEHASMLTVYLEDF
ncbi:hypothetical protein GLX_28500 (plasmid) [Komagataeibacter medellinensis NBRC 3288]|uniref:Uncharacterized protein n=3 Tax=Acetobacteraceae TaxID=433 RepID=A0A318Q7G1_9PROT|nr:hypothetical protein CFR72_16440 [Gluconacetobacter entanii]BAK86004.1 hypothetical protein GLX_28500 [Komagataeibacter medellinensis NBRC 3288]